MTEFLARHHRNIGRGAVAVLGLVILLAVQAAVFHRLYAPRVEAANASLAALVAETANRDLYRDLRQQVDGLIEAETGAEDTARDGEERTLAEGWQDFAGHYAAAPREALEAFSEELPALTAGTTADAESVAVVRDSLARLQDLYSHDYRDLLDELRRPPLFLWPAAGVIAERTGYRQAAAFNRALYLAQTGDIGTARVMLAGLNATVDDPEMLARIYYLLARLQFELFLQTPEIEYYTQSLTYLRESLLADSRGQLPRRLLDFLLSLPQSATAPQSAEGRPETPSEGEGAAVSAEKRIF